MTVSGATSQLEKMTSNQYSNDEESGEENDTFPVTTIALSGISEHKKIRFPILKLNYCCNIPGRHSPLYDVCNDGNKRVQGCADSKGGG